MTAFAKVENGKVVDLDYSGNAADLPGWVPLVGEPPDFDPATHGPGIPAYEVRNGRAVAVYPAPITLPVADKSALSLADRLAAVEARLDKAANATVTGEAAKLRDGLKPTAF